MITVQNFTEAVDFRITGGSTFGWDCFGPDARWLDSDESDQYTASIVLAGESRTVYLAEAHDLINDRSYRWINPEYAAAYQAAADKVGVDNTKAYDDVKFIDVEPQDLLEKLSSMVRGNFDYDSRLSVSVDIDDSVLFDLMKIAHQKDITFNQLVEQILREAMNKDE